MGDGWEAEHLAYITASHLMNRVPISWYNIRRLPRCLDGYAHPELYLKTFSKTIRIHRSLSQSIAELNHIKFVDWICCCYNILW